MPQSHLATASELMVRQGRRQPKLTHIQKDRLATVGLPGLGYFCCPIPSQARALLYNSFMLPVRLARRQQAIEHYSAAAPFGRKSWTAWLRFLERPGIGWAKGCRSSLETAWWRLPVAIVASLGEPPTPIQLCKASSRLRAGVQVSEKLTGLNSFLEFPLLARLLQASP